MSNRFVQLKSFITYWLDAVDEHSLHSPFFFNFYAEIIKGKLEGSSIDQIEKIRNNLLSDQRTIDLLDLGSGSDQFKEASRKVNEIARTSLSSKKYSHLYARIIRYFGFKTVLELGTSLGVNTLYLASTREANVTTFEGSPAVAEIAQGLFDHTDSTNVQILTGDIGETLIPYLQSVKQVDFAFLDANHRYEPTLNYFRLLLPKIGIHSIVVIDDIHYSSEMEKAWTEIKMNERVNATVDLYRCGIVFFNPSLTRQHFVLQF